ncbi:hypothetical protein THMIRHAS_11310 [Thiosulfatimonas sediminis]|uniref:MYND-type domain-containing protein n=1 Tax=Thiosulfatimonas sediminis TaxID=2675054 RepID=A0A6F8PUS5_9GAMM|nr:PP0621 family protein [Thiosulfatimonas sediminis]BBP45758.1 hypothetical protein THMIRHAS_11310 [Thiosulfatimonas sediminis]
MRSIFLFLIVIVVFLLVMAVINNRRTRMAKQVHKNTQHPEKPSEKMVHCEVCQTYLPVSEAICDEEKCFCNQKHLQEFKQKNSR